MDRFYSFQPQRASDDLLQLAGNPFADMFGAPQPAAAQTAQAQNNMWITNGNGKYCSFVLLGKLSFRFIILSAASLRRSASFLPSYFWFVGFAAVPPANNNFVTDNSFSSVFGNQESQPGEYSLPTSPRKEDFVITLVDQTMHYSFLSPRSHCTYTYPFLRFYCERPLA